MEPFATPDDVAETWGELTAAQETKVEAWLREASNKLRLRGRRSKVDIDALIAGDELLTQMAQDAVVNAVKRVLMNERGLRQRSETTGPFTESETIDTSISTGMIYISEGDLIGLVPSTRQRIRSFSVRSGFRG